MTENTLNLNHELGCLNIHWREISAEEKRNYPDSQVRNHAGANSEPRWFVWDETHDNRKES